MPSAGRRPRPRGAGRGVRSSLARAGAHPEGAGYEPQRADLETSGGFIHRAMYERLLVAELVIRRRFLREPNVAYEWARGTAPAALARCSSARTATSRARRGSPSTTARCAWLPYDIAPDGSLRACRGGAGTRWSAHQRRARRDHAQRQPDPAGVRDGALGEALARETDVSCQRMKYVSAQAGGSPRCLPEGWRGELEAIQRELTTDPPTRRSPSSTPTSWRCSSPAREEALRPDGVPFAKLPPG